MVAVNADAVVRLTRAALPAISPTPAPDYPSRVRPPRQQSRLAVGAQFVIVAGLICPRPIRSIWLSCNRFTKKVDGLSARQGSEIANPEPGSPCGQRDSCIITIIHDAATACRFTGEIPHGRAEQGCWCSYITFTTPYYGTAPAAVYRRGLVRRLHSTRSITRDGAVSTTRSAGRIESATCSGGSLYLRGNCHALHDAESTLDLQVHSLACDAQAAHWAATRRHMTSLIVVVHHQIRTRRQGVPPRRVGGGVHQPTTTREVVPCLSFPLQTAS